MLLKDTIAVITGGSRGVGRAIALSLVKEGAKVALADILQSEGEQFARELNESVGQKVAIFAYTDVTKYADLVKLFDLTEKELGGIICLNAGIARSSDSLFEPFDDEQDQKILDVNIGGVMKGTKVAVLHLAKRGGGVIVNTASAAGFFTMPCLNVYSTTKHAVIGWTRSLDMLAEICNVRVNAVCPAFIETDLLDTVTSDQDPVEPSPAADLIKAFPRVKMSAVVEAVLTLIKEPSRIGETLLVLPESTIIPQERPSLTEEYPPETVAALEKYDKDSLVYYQAKLKHALGRLGL